MKLGYTIIYVESVPQTLSFYEAAFGLSRRMLSEEEDYGELETGEATLAFASEGLRDANGLTMRDNRPGDLSPGIEIALVTPDVEGATACAIEAGAVLLHDAVHKPWGQVVAYVQDPNGVVLELCSPM